MLLRIRLLQQHWLPQNGLDSSLVYGSLNNKCSDTIQINSFPPSLSLSLGKKLSQVLCKSSRLSFNSCYPNNLYVIMN